MAVTTRAEEACTLESASRGAPVRPCRIALLIAIRSVYCLVRLAAQFSVALRSASNRAFLSA
jgi:hypothetical protein